MKHVFDEEAFIQINDKYLDRTVGLLRELREHLGLAPRIQTHGKVTKLWIKKTPD